MWDCAASIWAKLKKARITIGDADLIIASQCIISGYTIVTRNVKHFNPINGLSIENWVV
jgi:predicted nucleic acid-binding protein